MISLLMLSTVLLVPAPAATAAVLPDKPLTVEQLPLTQMRHGLPQQMIEEMDEEQLASRFDAMEIRPEGDICYKIRAYVFSTAPVPKLMKETTCGPKRGEVRSIDGARPRMMPLDASGDTVTERQR